VKTDSLFYRIFQRWPELVLELAEIETSQASRYVFRSEEIKQTAFRIDGVLAPPEDSDAPWVFVEIQFQPDDSLYRRLFAEVFLFLHRTDTPRAWRAVVLYPDQSIERVPLGYASLLSLPEIRRVDLSALSGLVVNEADGQDRKSLGWEILHILIAEDPQAAIQRARRLTRPEYRAQLPEAVDWPELLDFVETVMVYKLPRSSREEIQAMLGLTDIDLKQTRFYKDVLAEGRQEGREEGRGEGRREEAIRLLKRLTQRRFGPLPPTAEAAIDGADLATLESWLDRVVDAPSLDAILKNDER
jgi:predicted transposase/invertase (TIGR01784 family)